MKLHSTLKKTLRGDFLDLGPGPIAFLFLVSITWGLDHLHSQGQPESMAGVKRGR